MSKVEALRETSTAVYLNTTQQTVVESVQEATTQLNEKLAAIEYHLLRGQDGEEHLLKETTSALQAALEVCAECDAHLIQYPTLLKEQRIEFREKTHRFFMKSYLMNHARIWPLGYPGDFKMLEAVYRNQALSDGIGYFLDRYFLSTTLAEGVRSRLSLLRELLRKELESRRTPKVLDIACGSCREIFDLAPEIQQSGAEVVCIDQDGDALDYVLSRLSGFDILPQLNLRKYNAARLISHERNLKEFGPQDLIYSTGLFDYLTDDLLVRLLGALYELLQNDGKLICAFKDAARYRTQDYHWLVDWDAFYQRTTQEVRNLLKKAAIPDDGVTTLRDRTGVMEFYVVTKQ